MSLLFLNKILKVIISFYECCILKYYIKTIIYYNNLSYIFYNK